MSESVRRLLAALLVLLMALTGCADQPPAPVLVGADPHADSLLLAHIYAAGLRFHGTRAEVSETTDALAALDSAQVRVTAGLTGELLSRFDPTARARGAERVYRAMVAALPEGVAAGDYATAGQDGPLAVVSPRIVEAWGGDDLVELVRHCAGLRMGAVDSTVVPQRVGTCALGKVARFADQDALWGALRQRRIDVAWTTTVAAAPPADLTGLVDAKPVLIRAQNVVPLYRRNELADRDLVSLNEIAGVLDTAALRQMRQRVRGGDDPRDVAEAWLAENPIGR